MIAIPAFSGRFEADQLLVMQRYFGLLACFERPAAMQASSRTEWRRYSPAAAAAAALLLAGLLITSQV